MAGVGGEASGDRQRAWTDLGENEGWRDPAQGRVRALGQVRGSRASARGTEDIQEGGGVVYGGS